MVLPDCHTDPRTIRSRRAVTDATVALMVERGIHALSIDAISEASGVAKTTIYRQWPSREAIILDALSGMMTEDADPLTGSIEEITDLAWKFAVRIGTTPWSTLLPDLLSLAGRSPTMHTLYEGFLRGRRKPLAVAIGIAMEQGTVERYGDAEFLSLAILGPITFRQLVQLNPPDETFVHDVVTAALRLPPPLRKTRRKNSR